MKLAKSLISYSRISHFERVMEGKLYMAAVTGDVTSLLSLIQEDPLILDRLICSSFTETPLHISSMLGHLDFTLEILRLKPQLAGELDLRRQSPLYLAAANGHLEIVKALLVIDSTMCIAKDRNGRTPLHIAAIKGRILVLKELFQAVPEAIQFRACGGETILHLCVRYYQLDTLKFLVKFINEIDFLNWKDNNGFTALQLATIDCQTETINFLSKKIQTVVLSSNENIYKDLDVESTHNQGCLQDLKRNNDFPQQGGATVTSLQPQATTHKELNRLEQYRNAVMVVASLIATMSFQIAANPPGGVWQENGQSHQAGSSIMADRLPVHYKWFVALNATGFLASVGVILLLISGLPFNGEIFTGVLLTVMWIAVASMAGTYGTALSLLSSRWTNDQFGFGPISAYIVYGFVSMVLLGNLFRLVLWIVKVYQKVDEKVETFKFSC